MFKRKDLVFAPVIGLIIGLLLLFGAAISEPPRTFDSMSLIPPPKSEKDLVGNADLVIIGEIGDIVQKRTYSGYGPQGELLDGFNANGDAVPTLPITDFELKIERILKDDGRPAKGMPVILRMAGDATAELKMLTAGTEYPMSYTGDRHLFLLTLNPDGATYGLYYGPSSRLIIDGDVLRVSDGSQRLLVLDGNDKGVTLEGLAQSIQQK